MINSVTGDNKSQHNVVKAGEGSSPTTAKIVNLVPPIINSTTIQEKIVCVRPTREVRFNISLEEKGSKTVVHCYGQGGAGWTTLFGSVERAVGLFKQKNLDLNTPIRVVGSGCMGLAMIIELFLSGYKNVSLSTKEQINLPSWKAAGYFALVSVLTGSDEDKKMIDEVAMRSFRVYQAIGNGQHAYINKDAVRYLPVFCSSDTESGLEALEQMGEIPKREPVTLSFGNGVKHENFYKYMTYFLDTTNLMRQMIKRVEELNIPPFTVEEITSFDLIKENVVFNCTGMGARDLCQDKSLVPTCGHLLTLNKYAGSRHLDYMIYSKVANGEYVYMFPKKESVTTDNPSGVLCNGLLGGSFIPNVDKLLLEEQTKLHKQEFEKMKHRNQRFFYGFTVD